MQTSGAHHHDAPRSISFHWVQASPLPKEAVKPTAVSLESNAMTPEDKKLITVITRLYAKTKADVVDWEPSEGALLPLRRRFA
jgi:hypothetical protein